MLTMFEFVLSALMILFVLAELWQVYMIRRTINGVIPVGYSLEDFGADTLAGFVTRLNEDEEFQKAFFSIVATSFQVGAQSVLGNQEGAIDTSKVPKKYQGIIGVAQAIGLDKIIMSKVQQSAATVADKGAAKAVDKLFG